MCRKLIGSALYRPKSAAAPIKASQPERFGHIIARMQQVPHFLDVAQRQLGNAPHIWIDVAKEENGGNIDLIDKTLRDAAPAEQKAAFNEAAAPALDSLRGFNRYLETELLRRARA